MNELRLRFSVFASAPLVAAALVAIPAPAQGAEEQRPAAAAAQGSDLQSARKLVRDSVRVVGKMKADPAVKGALSRARGIVIVPEYVRAGLGIGGRGGEAVMLARRGGGRWSGPVFYNTGGASVGVQAGAEAGAVAFLLMSDKAVDAFKGEGAVSLNAEVGYTLIDSSKLEQATAGEGVDVVAWSGTEGLFAGATVSVTGAQWDSDETRAYYGSSDATPKAILGGTFDKKGDSEAAELQRALNP